MQFMKNLTQAPCDAVNVRKAKARKIKTTPMYCDVCPLYGGPATLRSDGRILQKFHHADFWVNLVQL